MLHPLVSSYHLFLQHSRHGQYVKYLLLHRAIFYYSLKFLLITAITSSSVFVLLVLKRFFVLSSIYFSESAGFHFSWYIFSICLTVSSACFTNFKESFSH